MANGRARSLAIFAAIATVCIAADLASKRIVGDWIAAHGAVVIIPGWLQLVFHTNPYGLAGAGWFLGAHANTLLQVFSAVATLAIIIWAVTALDGDRTGFAATLGLILGGAIGNLHDRWVFNGVRDFIDAHYYDLYHYPTFNLADSFLVCGAGLLVITSFKKQTAAEGISTCSASPAATAGA